MNSKNYYKLNGALDASGSGKFYSGNLDENESEILNYTSKPFLISYTHAMKGVKAILLLLMFSSLFIIGLTAQTVRTIGSIGLTDYSTINDAFNDVNSGAISGEIIFQLTSNVTETQSSTLNANGSGSASYSSILIIPDAGQKVFIQGNLSGGLITFDGSSNVTINGLNTNGDSLVIENLNTSGHTILFTSSAFDNLITNTTILGGNSSASSGVIHFSTASGSLAFGNINNTISNCDISNASNGNYPLHAIYSDGTASKENQNTITNCRISNFFNATATHSGIRLNSNNNSWTISNNKLYRSTELTITSASVLTNGIYINDGSSYTITQNTIGYNSYSDSGVFKYNVSNTGHTFNGIYLSTNSDQSNVISGNKISGIEINAASNSFVMNGIFLDAVSNPSIFTVENNTIGSLNQSNAIVLKTTNRLDLYPIKFNGASFEILADITANSIGSINSGAVSIGSLFTSMVQTSGSVSSDFLVYENIIGASGNGIINLGTIASAGDYRINGINLAHSGSIDLNGNSIQYLYENSTGTTSPYLYGINISFTGGNSSNSKLIRNNTIHELVAYSGASSFGSRVCSGIFIASGNNTYTLEVNDNTIYDIKYLGADSVSNGVSGIAIPGTTQKMKIYGNSIYGIENNSRYACSSSTFNAGGIYGIEMNNSTNSTNRIEIYNNRIYLKADNNSVPTCIPIRGIDVHSLSSVYYNTVVISGSSCASGGTTIPTTCFSAGQYLEIPVYNNVFYNDRSGNGKHYAIVNDGYTTYSTTNYTCISDYNIYYTADTSTMAKWGSSDRTFTTWKSSVYNGGTGPNVDLNSQNTDPLMADVTDMDFWGAGGSSSPMINTGTPITDIEQDYEGNDRDATNPYIGAYEKIINIWIGSISDDWNNAANWNANILPLAGENIFFSPFTVNHCIMDDVKTVKNIYNMQSTYNLVLNGFTLTVDGNIVLENNAKIDATDSGSCIVLNSEDEQVFPAGSIVNNEIYHLINNTSSGIFFYNDIQILNTLEMSYGNIEMNSNTLELGTSASIPGDLNYNTGFIIGEMTRWFSNTTNSGNTGLFPIRYNDYDRTVTVEYTSAPTTGGTLTVNVNPGDMGSDGLPITNIAAVGICASFDVTNTSDNGYWVIDDGNGLSGGAYDITLIGEGIAGIIDICELTAIKRVGSGNWLESGTHLETTGSTFYPIVKRAGATGWSNWGFGGSNINPLPLSFLSVKANCSASGNTINWTTTVEDNIQKFAVERSIDGKIWETIKFIPAQSIFASINNYSYTDLQVSSSNFYYRVRYIEFDQQMGLSPIVPVECLEDETIQLSLYPNPTSSTVTIKSTEALETIEVMNAFGNVVLTVYSDDVEFTLDIKDLSPGVYFIKTEYAYSRLMKY